MAQGYKFYSLFYSDFWICIKLLPDFNLRAQILQVSSYFLKKY